MARSPTEYAELKINLPDSPSANTLRPMVIYMYRSMTELAGLHLN